MSEKRTGLGRGLAELGLSEILGNTTQLPSDIAVNQVMMLTASEIQPNPHQPRQDFNLAKLELLAQTIRAKGIIQPLLVRKKPDLSYELVAGERRLRAAKMAGLNQVPCVIKEITDNQSTAVLALLENLHREDLNIIEQAKGIRQLIEYHHLTHANVADILGFSRSSITNILRMLQLDPSIQEMLTLGKIEVGHAKCLLGMQALDQLKLATEVVSKGLSVRQLEALIAAPLKQTTPEIKNSYVHFQTRLDKRLSTTTVIKSNAKGGGKITIDYKSPDHLEKLIALIDG